MKRTFQVLSFVDFIFIQYQKAVLPLILFGSQTVPVITDLRGVRQKSCCGWLHKWNIESTVQGGGDPLVPIFFSYNLHCPWTKMKKKTNWCCNDRVLVVFTNGATDYTGGGTHSIVLNFSVFYNLFDLPSFHGRWCVAASETTCSIPRYPTRFVSRKWWRQVSGASRPLITQNRPSVTAQVVGTKRTVYDTPTREIASFYSTLSSGISGCKTKRFYSNYFLTY